LRDKIGRQLFFKLTVRATAITDPDLHGIEFVDARRNFSPLFSWPHPDIYADKSGFYGFNLSVYDFKEKNFQGSQFPVNNSFFNCFFIVIFSAIPYLVGDIDPYDK
jgi:hypothetical protein